MEASANNELVVKKFSPAKHLNTLPELVNRKFNRPTIDTLKKSVIAYSPDSAADDKVCGDICYRYGLYTIMHDIHLSITGNPEGSTNEV